MKKILLALGLGLAALHCALAQTLTLANGYSATPLFTVNGNGSYVLGLSALNADPSGNIYYIETNSFNGSVQTVIREFSAATQSPSTVTGDGTVNYGAFVVPVGQTVYYGANDAIKAYDMQTKSVTPVASVANNYSLAATASGVYLSANPNYNSSTFTGDAQIFKLSGGVATAVLDTGGDASGPIAFDAAGNLLYGSTSFGSLPANKIGIYRIPAAELASAVATQTQLSLQNYTPFITDASNSFFALKDGEHPPASRDRRQHDQPLQSHHRRRAADRQYR